MDSYRLIGPLLRRLPPEVAHRLTVRALAAGLARGAAPRDDPALAVRVWGIDFPNPIGLAAGFDKDAEAFDAALGLGFGFVEVGSVTPRPQPGNPRPRLFRLPEDRGVINRLGFNSRGHGFVAARLRRRRRGSGIVGVNLGANHDSADPAGDYAVGAAAFADLADYLVVNVSSPNTGGLRALQGRAKLTALLARVKDALAADAAEAPPLLLKIAPDLVPEDRRDIAAVVREMAVDGIIVSNTTVTRPPKLAGRFRGEAGGLSGRPLFALATEVLADMYRLTDGQVPLVGVGGVASGDDAYGKIRAGATLVQLYTALIYEGPTLVRRINRELAARLAADGFRSIGEAVGADHRAAGRPTAAVMDR